MRPQTTSIELSKKWLIDESVLQIHVISVFQGILTRYSVLVKVTSAFDMIEFKCVEEVGSSFEDSPSLCAKVYRAFVCTLQA